ncbi:MAG TPA: alpha/beta fold hydrolase, partial [Actinopolymorphaceae bacterium]
MTAVLGVGGVAVAHDVRPSGTGPETAASNAAPEIAWGPCEDLDDPQVDCGTVQVPLDHDDPGGPQVTIALERRRADDQDARIGSLFANPGGPGAIGTPFGRYATDVFGEEITRVFDVIGFDPRGVGKSSSVRCFSSDKEADALWSQVRLVPLSEEEIRAATDGAAAYSAACGERGGELLGHLSTVNVARDLDLLRAAVGDERLTYYGFSYGTLLGATYANLYPDRVRAMVLDGAVDPEGRVDDRMANKLERAAGFETALQGMLDACAASGDGCALHGGDLTAHEKFARLREHLRLGPVEHDGDIVTISSFTETVGSALYRRDRFEALTVALADLYAVAFPETVTARAERDLAPLSEKAAGRSGPWPDAAPFAEGWTSDESVLAGRANARTADQKDYSYNETDVRFGVNCVDAPLPRTPESYRSFALGFEQAHRTFGRAEAFGELPCATWPVVTEERYAGPWDASTRTILVV